MEAVAPILDVVNEHPYLSLTSVVLGCTALVRLARWRSGPRHILPPGPKGYPLIGNLLDLPPSHIWEKFSELGAKYGPVVYLSVFGQDMVILNTSEAAVDLLDKDSLTYSDRPVVMMCGEIIGWNKSLALTQYNDRFKKFRKYIGKFMGTRETMKNFTPLQEKEMAKLMARVMADPDSLVQHIRKATGTIILNIAYGYTVKDHDDPFVSVVEAAVQGFSESLEPGAYLVDVIPLLRYVPDWFPGTGWKARGKIFEQLLNDMANTPYQSVKDEMAAGKAVPSYTSELLRDSEKLTEETEYNIKWSAASLYSGGADTTVSSITSFFLAMITHPEVQIKAQEEIDRVIGNDRLPELADKDHLPYVDAVVKELLRWNPVTPASVPHVATKDGLYKGYFIPKGSTVIANLWQILHDPNTYADPMKFNPDRFLGNKPEPDPRMTAFGHGRRICPGQNLALSSMWIACANALAVFNIKKYADELGNVVEPDTRYTGGTISHPPPFKCAITPRSEKCRRLVALVEI